MSSKAENLRRELVTVQPVILTDPLDKTPTPKQAEQESDALLDIAAVLVDHLPTDADSQTIDIVMTLGAIADRTQAARRLGCSKAVVDKVARKHADAIAEVRKHLPQINEDRRLTINHVSQEIVLRALHTYSTGRSGKLKPAELLTLAKACEVMDRLTRLDRATEPQDKDTGTKAPKPSNKSVEDRVAALAAVQAEQPIE